MNALPIDDVLPELLAALENGNNAILVAEPGAGKTTRVPLALLEQAWLKGRRVIMLEPRRLAARSAAQFMAASLGEKVGDRVGYRVRLDSKVSSRTVIEVVTEGVLTRMLQEDPTLEGIGAILFDEFHERHLHGDLGLALSLQSQALLREDLRLVVMSATLDSGPLSELLGHAPILLSRGRTYPVETRYRSVKGRGSIESLAGETILEAIRREEGDVLAFLPGVPEIRRTARWLREHKVPDTVKVLELHGGMSLEGQAAVVAKGASHERKIVLATSIAESSLTVEGVTTVVDSGLMRVPRFSPKTGMSRLETIPVSKASADQRRGRAGRLAPGVCYRLWTEAEQAYLPEHGKPELSEADLASMALELAVWGVRDPLELTWLTPPPQAAYAQAVTLLQQLKALDKAGKPTMSGSRIARLGLHPRLGAMLLAARHQGALKLSCELAALLSDRDLLPGERNVDISLRLDVLRGGNGIVNDSVYRLRTQAEQWMRMLEEIESQTEQSENASMGAIAKQAVPSIGVMLAVAFPDRIAQRRSDGRYVLSNGRGAVLPELQPLYLQPYLVVCELEDSGTEGRIRSAAGIRVDELEKSLLGYLEEKESIEWDAGAMAVRARRRLMLGSLTLNEKPIEQPDPEAVADALLQAIRQKGFSMLPLTKASQSLLARMRLMALSGDAEWPDVSEEGLMESLDHWLKPHLYGIKSSHELQKLPLAQMLGSRMSWKQAQELEEQVPTHWTAPSGSRIPIDYTDPTSPVLAVRLQELFGLRETPRLAKGRLPVTLHLLSPSQRPVQVTRDLESFWANAYFEVKKDLKGRYPKHDWPDDPYKATPTNRVRRRP